MKTVHIENAVIYTEIKNLSEITEKLVSPEAPVIVIYPAENNEADENTVSSLKKCSSLTAIAGESLSGFSPEILNMFDLRLTERNFADVSNDEITASLCGEHSAYSLNKGNGTNGYFTFLDGEEAFSEKVSQYIAFLTKDKSKFQLYALASCFMAARTGSAEAVFEQESLQFYRLMQKKAEEVLNGTEA